MIYDATQGPDSWLSGALMGDFSLQTFEDSGRQNGIRYWYAHELMDSLGYDSWAAFQGVITKSMAACARLGMDPTESFVPETLIEEGKPKKTYRLSRFACLLVAMTADSKKSEVAQAKAVLAAVADQLIEAHIQSEDFGRLDAREDLKDAEKVMCTVAVNAGLDPINFGIFKDAGFRGMYNMGLRDLQARKGLPSGKTLYDFMGLEELAGNLFRVTQTSARVKSKQVSGLNQLADTAKAVGGEVRQMMLKNSGVAPEDLRLEEDVSKVKGKLKKVGKEMGKIDGPKKPKPKG